MKTIKQLGEGLKTRFKKVGVMTGAGISVNAGIPDFRSKSGLYSKLSNPELIFDFSYFKKNPAFFYKAAPGIITPEASPTYSHYFISFLQHKELLNICYSQNIDGLEKKAGVTKLVQAHGNIEKAHCIECRKEFSRKEVVAAMMKALPLICGCGGPVKPDVVFFGESLPEEFERNVEVLRESDLLIVIGTSLMVYPFAGLVNAVGNVPRVVVNDVELGSFGQAGLDFAKESRDSIFVGDSDLIFKEIVEAAGWTLEFKETFAQKIN